MFGLLLQNAFRNKIKKVVRSEEKRKNEKYKFRRVVIQMCKNSIFGA